MKKMNHTDYPKSLVAKSTESLRWILNDCREAIEAMPNGGNVSYYSDEICYIGMELKKREVAFNKAAS